MPGAAIVDRREHRLGRQRGFTLLELLVTLAITTIGMLGILSLHVSLSRGNDGAARAAESITVAKETVEWLRTLRYDDMLSALGTTAPGGTDVVVDLTPTVGRAGMSYRRRVTLRKIVDHVATNSQLIRLRVEVAWTEDGAAPVGFASGPRDRSIAFELLRTNQEAL